MLYFHWGLFIVCTATVTAVEPEGTTKLPTELITEPVKSTTKSPDNSPTALITGPVKSTTKSLDDSPTELITEPAKRTTKDGFTIRVSSVLVCSKSLL